MPGIQKAGEWDLMTAILITSEGKSIDLLDSKEYIKPITIVIFEDISQGSISGQITISDTLATPSIGPIVGQEYLVLKLKTPTVENDNQIIDFTENVFLIYSIDSRKSLGDKIQIYTLNFCTSEFMKSQRIRISKILKGTHSDIVDQMLQVVNCKKNKYIDPTVGHKKIVAINEHPFGIIATCRTEARTLHNVSPTYLFFETLRGFHFRSLESLYNEGIAHKYIPLIPGTLINKDG